MLKLRTYTFTRDCLCSSFRAATQQTCSGCSGVSVLIDLAPDVEYYFWDIDKWEKVTGHRCCVPMCVRDSGDIIEIADFPPEAKDFVLHTYVCNTFTGFMLGPV